MPELLLTFDYELFFGARPGTVEACLIEPTAALLAIAARRAARFVFFVDAGFLFRLNDQARADASVRRQLGLVRRQLSAIQSAGHELQLHVHPHWEDSFWRDGSWHVDASRYALQSFDADEALMSQEVV